jgi:hypothetical protein
MMSNNAQGFNHITFNTRRPIKTVIGNFEFNLLLVDLEPLVLILQVLKEPMQAQNCLFQRLIKMEKLTIGDSFKAIHLPILQNGSLDYI